MIDGVKRTEVLPPHIQLQYEAVKAAEAVEHWLTQTHTHTLQKRMSGQTK